MYHLLRSVRWAWRRMVYHAYLRSSTWWRIRTAVMIRDRWTCVYDGAPATQVHHLTYAHIFREGDHLSDLVAVCARCHARLSGIVVAR